MLPLKYLPEDTRQNTTEHRSPRQEAISEVTKSLMGPDYGLVSVSPNFMLLKLQDS